MAGKLGCGGGPLPFLFPPVAACSRRCCKNKCASALQGMPVQPAPRAALEAIEPELFLELLVRLLAHPARLDERGQLLQCCVRRQVGQIVLVSPDERCSPTSHTSSPGRCWAACPCRRTAGPSATRTRTAANFAFSGPLVPRRHVT